MSSILLLINIIGSICLVWGAHKTIRNLRVWRQELRIWSDALAQVTHRQTGALYPSVYWMASTRPSSPRRKRRCAAPKEAEHARDEADARGLAHPCSFEGCQGADVRRYYVGCVELGRGGQRVMATAWLCNAHVEVYLQGIPEEALLDLNPWRFREIAEGEEGA